MQPSSKPPAYIAFIDESGDPGLKKSASDWFISSAVLVRAANEPLIQGWIADIKQPMKNQKRLDLHFTKLDLGMRRRACTMVGALSVRGFTNISRKANMVNYRNLRAENRPARRVYLDDEQFVLKPENDWFQNWTFRVLLERVTWYCARLSIREYKEPRTVKIVIGSRDGFYIQSFIDYLKLDLENQRAGTDTLKYHPDWRVLDWNQIVEAPAAGEPGLQLADVLCGGFSHAVDKKRYGSCDASYAAAFRRIMARGPSGDYADSGVTTWPRPLTKGKRPLAPDQVEIFRLYGLGEKWLGRPGPTFSAR